MEVILYSDFNCPFCYALGERINAAGVADRMQWRGVQHAPPLKIPMAPDPYLSAELHEEVRAIRQLAPEIAIAVPPGKPNTGPAIAAVAAALVTAAPITAVLAAHAFKDSLYRAFWQHGADLSDPRVLHELSRAAGLPEYWDTVDVAATVARWRAGWMSSGFRGVPAILCSDGRRLEGLVSQQVLQEFMQG